MANASQTGNWRRHNVKGSPATRDESNDRRRIRTRSPACELARILASITCWAILVITIRVPLQSPDEGSKFGRRIMGQSILRCVRWRGVLGRAIVLRYSWGMLWSGAPPSCNALSTLRYSFNCPGSSCKIKSLTLSTSILQRHSIMRSLKYWQMSALERMQREPRSGYMFEMRRPMSHADGGRQNPSEMLISE